MKICLPQFILDRGRSGIAAYMQPLISNLQKIDRDHDYEILLSQAENPLIPLVAKNFNKVIYPTSFENPLFNIFWYHALLPLRALRKNYHLIHIPDLRRMIFCKPCKLIVTVHDLAAFTVCQKYSPSRIWYHQQMLSRLIHRADLVIAVSQQTKADILKWTHYPEDKIRVIYSGIDRTIYYPMPPDKALALLSAYHLADTPFLVYVSRVEHPGKNHLNLIKAFELFKKRYPNNLKLVCAGAMWTGSEVVRTYAAESKVASSIDFLGFVPQEVIVALYSLTQLMIFPSFYEGFGFPLLEAMACGAKVICANTSALKEIGEKNCDLFDPHSPSDICRAMVQTLDQENSLTSQENKNKFLEKFDWQQCATQVVKVYKEVLS